MGSKWDKFGRFTRNYAETVPFHKISTPRNQVKLRYFSQCCMCIFRGKREMNLIMWHTVSLASSRACFCFDRDTYVKTMSRRFHKSCTKSFDDSVKDIITLFRFHNGSSNMFISDFLFSTLGYVFSRENNFSFF